MSRYKGVSQLHCRLSRYSGPLGQRVLGRCPSTVPPVFSALGFQLSKQQNRTRTTFSTVLGTPPTCTRAKKNPLEELGGGCFASWVLNWESTENWYFHRLGTVHETVLGHFLRFGGSGHRKKDLGAQYSKQYCVSSQVWHRISHACFILLPTVSNSLIGSFGKGSLQTFVRHILQNVRNLPAPVPLSYPTQEKDRSFQISTEFLQNFRNISTTSIGQPPHQ